MQINTENMAAVEKMDGRPLGYLTWYTISEIEIDRYDLEQKLIRWNFDKHMPRQISPSDAFRRATTDVQKKNVGTGDKDIFYNYLVREVYSDTKEIVRHIVIEARDKKDKKLFYDPDTAVIRYDKKDNKIDSQSTSLAAEELVQEAISNFNKYRYFYHSRLIRDVVAEILASLTPIPVRPSGGVYFVPEKHESQLIDLIGLINDLNSCEAYKVPLINTNEHRDMVRKKVNDYIVSSIKNAADFLKTGKFDKTTANLKLNEIKKVISDYSAYREEVSLSIGDMTEAITLLRKQATTILDRLSLTPEDESKL